MSKISLKLVTEGGIPVEGQYDEVRVPTSSGEAGFLPGHAVFIGAIGVGMLYAIEKGEKVVEVLISGGLVSYEDDTLKVITRQVITVGSTRWDELKSRYTEIESSFSTMPAGNVSILNEVKLARIVRDVSH